MRQRVAHRRSAHVLDAGHHIAHLAGGKRSAAFALGRENTYFVHGVDAPDRLGEHFVARRHDAVEHAHQRHDAKVVVEPRIDDERLERRLRIAIGRGHAHQQRLQQSRHSVAGLRAHRHRVVGRQADEIFDFGGGAFGFGLRQIDLVQHRQHLQPLIDGRDAVGDRLRLDALGRVHDQQRPFARRQRTRDLVAEVHVPRRVDEIQPIGFAIARAVLQRDALRLDGDAPLALDVHGIQHLIGHLPRRKRPAQPNEPIRQRGLAVVDVGDDGEVADVCDGCHSALNREARAQRLDVCAPPPRPPAPPANRSLAQRSDRGQRRWRRGCRQPSPAPPTSRHRRRLRTRPRRPKRQPTAVRTRAPPGQEAVVEGAPRPPPCPPASRWRRAAFSPHRRPTRSRRSQWRRKPRAPRPGVVSRPRHRGVPSSGARRRGGGAAPQRALASSMLGATSRWRASPSRPACPGAASADGSCATLAAMRRAVATGTSPITVTK